MGRRRIIWGAIAFVLALCVAMSAYLRTRPVVSDDEMREALEEVEQIRASLDEFECRRPAVFGAPSELAMSLEDLLRFDGPFAECWEGTLELNPEHARDPLERCSALAEEVARQARAPNRCTPYPPSSEHWRQQVAAGSGIRFEHPFFHQVQLLANSGDMPDDDRFRLLVQGMVVARDLAQGPAGFEQAYWAAWVETELATAFVFLFETKTPSPAAVVELRDALGVLADMPIDAHALLSAEGIANIERSLASTTVDPSSRLDTYAAAIHVSDLQVRCPLGGTVEACISHLPALTFAPQPPTAWLEMQVLGKRFVRGGHIHGMQFHFSRDYPDNLIGLEKLRVNARALQEILRWSEERAAGRCPQQSPWLFAESGDRFYVDRNLWGVYRLITPGEPQEFHFRCSVEEPL